MKPDANAIVRELNEVLQEWDDAIAQYRNGNEYPINDPSLPVKMAAAINRHAPPKSPYRLYNLNLPADLSGALRALRDDYAKGRMRSVIELIHADLFGDFLDMAKHLADQAYKDAAAVVAGSALEGHLRKLADMGGVQTRESSGAPRKASTLNSELRKAGIYGGGEEKQITAFPVQLDLRLRS